MIQLEYVPLTFISDKEEIKKQISNTLILNHLITKHGKSIRLENLIEGTQYGYNASALESGRNKFLRISDIQDNKVNWEQVPYCNCDDTATYELKENDILIARTGGTTGKSFKVTNPPKDSIYAGYLIRIRASNETSADYLSLFLNSYTYWNQIVNLNEGNFRPKANAENLKSLLLPECDKSIQDEAVRISRGERIQGYETLFDQIEKALGEFDKTSKIEFLLNEQISLTKKLRTSVMREATRGKIRNLVSTDESASRILERVEKYKIQNEKKEVKILALKPEEIPFEIPKNWIWCKLSQMSINRDGEREPISLSERNGRKKIFDYYGASGVIDKIDDYTHDGRFLLIGEDGANLVARSTPIAFVVEGKFWVNNHAHVIETLDEVTLDFLCYYINSISLKPFITGGFQPKLSQGNLNNIPIPLPPLNEQEQIVTELKALLDQVTKLEQKNFDNLARNDDLIKAILHDAFQLKESVF